MVQKRFRHFDENKTKILFFEYGMPYLRQGLAMQKSVHSALPRLPYLNKKLFRFTSLEQGFQIWHRSVLK